MIKKSFAHILTVSVHLLASQCGAVLASASLLALPGCSDPNCTGYVAEKITLTTWSVPVTSTLHGVVVMDYTVFETIYHLPDVATATKFEAFAVGENGAVISFYEGYWHPLDSGVSANLYAVTQDPEAFALAVGAGGLILRHRWSEAGMGWQWEKVDTGITEDLRAVTFLGSSSIGVAVGGGTILRTEDGGATWLPAQVPAQTAGLRSVAFRPVDGSTAEPFELLAVGDAGLALLSKDNGATWSVYSLPTTADLYAVASTSTAGAAWWLIASADGKVLHERNGTVEAEELSSTIYGLSSNGECAVGYNGALFLNRLGQWRPWNDGGFASGPVRLLACDGRYAVGEDGVLVEVSSKPPYTYDACVPMPDGRPFIIDGQARTAEAVCRDDWAASVAVSGLPGSTRERLATAWRRDGLYEHASIGSFARFVLHLLAVGAPPELVLEGQAALADEVRHAQTCFGLASAYAESPVGPGPLAIDGALSGSSDLAELARATVVEGCINETIAALKATAAAALAEDEAVRTRLEGIAADERRHAALAWRTVAWALKRGDAGVREAVAEAFATVSPPDVDTSEDGLEAHGRLSQRARAEVTRAAWREIIAPQAAMLLQIGNAKPIAPLHGRVELDTRAD